MDKNKKKIIVDMSLESLKELREMIKKVKDGDMIELEGDDMSILIHIHGE